MVSASSGKSVVWNRTRERSHRGVRCINQAANILVQGAIRAALAARRDSKGAENAGNEMETLQKD